MLIPIKVKINFVFGEKGQPKTKINNLWIFFYDKDHRKLYLHSHTQTAQNAGERSFINVRTTAKEGDDPVAKLLEALGGNEYDREKVSIIAKAKALEADCFMRYNEMSCIEILWYTQKPEGLK